MKRYRIRMNGNGQFLVEKRRLLFWSDSAYLQEDEEARSDPEKYHWSCYFSTFEDIRMAVRVLQSLQRRDAEERRSEQWATVLEE